MSSTSPRKTEPDQLMKVPPSPSEKKESDETIDSNVITATTMMPLHPVQCDMVFESMDECVGCLDGVGEQHTFEECMKVQAARQREIAVEHGLSEAEATLIRLQMIDDANDGIRTAVESTLTNITTNPLLLCGSGNISNEDDSTISQLCEGVVNPIDTTVPTSLPIEVLDDSLQGGHSTRSLVDAAAETETIHENFATLDASVRECAICNDSSGGADNGDLSSRSVSSSASLRKPTFCRFPCCEVSDYSENCNVCTACMLVLTVATKDGVSRVGRCPRCRSWISVNTLHSTSAVMDVSKLEASGKCETCLQMKQPLISENPSICDACFLGKEVPLDYECEECHQYQTIESTMYRSQPTATSVGNEMWPCNTCQKSTHWKIQFEQLSLIPGGDFPEEWGNDFLELARRRVQKTRQGIARLDVAEGTPTKNDGCVVM
ncbi:MAG: hypothetical protein SGILL_001408 [Bacillariaceae sp.]